MRAQRASGFAPVAAPGEKDRKPAYFDQLRGRLFGKCPGDLKAVGPRRVAVELYFHKFAVPQLFAHLRRVRVRDAAAPDEDRGLDLLPRRPRAPRLPPLHARAPFPLRPLRPTRFTAPHSLQLITKRRGRSLAVAFTPGTRYALQPPHTHRR